MPALSTLRPSSSISFPHEILREIFSYCEPPTLAAVSRVSFACLELTSRLLYEDVVAPKTPLLLMILFRDPFLTVSHIPKSARVSPHTSLGLIRSITVIVDAKETLDLDSVIGRRSPFRTPDRPLVSVLTIHLGAISRVPKGKPYPVKRVCQAGHLLAFFSPTTLVVQGSSAPLPIPTISFLDGGDSPMSSFHWKRLTTIIRSQVWFQRGATAMEIWAEAEGREQPAQLVFDCLSMDERGYLGELDFEMFSGTILPQIRYADEYAPNLKLKAWVQTGDVKKSFEAMVKDVNLSDKGRLEVEVASDRMVCLREELIKGVRKGVDWAALVEE